MEDHSPYFQIVDGRPVIADEERLKRDLEEFNRNVRFLISNYEMLLDQYPDQWIALYHEKVVATDITLEDLLVKLDELGIRRKGQITEFLSTSPTRLIV